MKLLRRFSAGVFIPAMALLGLGMPVSGKDMGPSIPPPANVRVIGAWDPTLKAPRDHVSWDAVPGAAYYNLYRYDRLIGTTQGTSYDVAPAPQGLVYTVTAVDTECGCETIPSALAIVPWIPKNVSSLTAPAKTVHTPTAIAQWNAGHPRNLIAWRVGSNGPRVNNVYRDGQLLATGVERLYYVDDTARPGATYTYTLRGRSPGGLEGPDTLGVTVTSLASAPQTAGGKVNITKVVPNTDSALVVFDPVPGAADYYAYDVSSPMEIKYAGGSHSIEVNGLDPSMPHTIVVVAVDKLGPFERMDGMAPIPVQGIDGVMSVNGQGDPSNVPIPLAQSDPVTVTCVPRQLPGEQVFFDNFSENDPLALQPKSAIDPDIWQWQKNQVELMSNSRWNVYRYQDDPKSTQIFIMGKHIMDTLYDGPYPNPWGHNNNASTVFMPKATADISGGKVLHVTMEVDPHMDGRRWCDIFVAAAGDPLLNPGKFAADHLPPTKSGNLFHVEFQMGSCNLDLYEPGTDKHGRGPTQHIGLGQFVNWADAQTMTRQHHANGTAEDLDKRHRFDLYVSRSRYRVEEYDAEGNLLLVRDRPFPAGVGLPFDKCQVYFVHQLYHTGNDHPDLIHYYPKETYWINYRPWADERHWNNLGFEVLNSFPG